MKRTLNIAISPCPNDTFIFEKIHNKIIGIEGIEFKFHFLDIEALNNCAMLQTMDIIKISYAQYFQIKQHYNLLRSGGAMGFGVGPLLVKKQNAAIDLANAKVAIPGVYTTANFLLSYLLPEIKNKTSIVFSDIENEVLNNNFDAGLLIHEGRFTFQEKGLEKIADMGELWQAKTQLPIPLGAIVIKKSLEIELQNKIEKLICNSIPKFENPIVLSPFIKLHAQEMNEAVMVKHIQLYVNEFSKDIGDLGQLTINKMESIFKTIN